MILDKFNALFWVIIVEIVDVRDVRDVDAFLGTIISYFISLIEKN